MCTQKLNMNIEFLNKHFSSSSSQKTRKTVLKSFKIDFKSIFPMKPSQFGNVCTKFELDPSNENRAIKKIRWVGQIRPGPFCKDISISIRFQYVWNSIKNIRGQDLMSPNRDKCKSNIFEIVNSLKWIAHFVCVQSRNIQRL